MICSKNESTFLLCCVVFTMVSTVAYCFMALIPIFLDFVVPLNETRPKNYVYDVNYIVFEKETHYYFIFCHSFIAGLYCIANITSTDLLLFYFLQHACGMFRVLGHKVRHIIDHNTTENNFSEKKSHDMKKQIIICIKLYDRNIMYLNKIENCFETALFFVMGITSMILCFQGVMIVVKIDEIDFVMRFLTNFIAEAFALFYYCLAGQNIINDSASLFICIYESNWNLMPLKHRKMILMLLTRSSQECKMTIGKLLILSMETYSSLMKTVFSYLSVLMSVRV